jgi:hypothetical protein
MHIDMATWESQGRAAIRDMIDALGGDLDAFQHDPLSALPLMDDFVLRMPWQQFEEDDWVWIHAQLVAFVAEVLQHHHDGVWKRLPAPDTHSGWIPVRLHGRPRRTASAPSRRSAVRSLRKQRGLSPVNGPVQDGCDTVITPATP